MKGDGFFFAIGLHRGDSFDALAARDDVLRAGLAHELEDVDRHDVVRARDKRHWRKPTSRDLRHLAATRAEKKGANDQQAKARTHVVIVRPGLAVTAEVC